MQSLFPQPAAGVSATCSSRNARTHHRWAASQSRPPGPQTACRPPPHWALHGLRRCGEAQAWTGTRCAGVVRPRAGPRYDPCTCSARGMHSGMGSLSWFGQPPMCPHRSPTCNRALALALVGRQACPPTPTPAHSSGLSAGEHTCNANVAKTPRVGVAVVVASKLRVVLCTLRQHFSCTESLHTGSAAGQQNLADPGRQMYTAHGGLLHHGSSSSSKLAAPSSLPSCA